MIDSVKILEIKLKLYIDIVIVNRGLLYNLREIVKVCENIMIYLKDEESIEDNVIFKLRKEQFDILQDLIYMVKFENIVFYNIFFYLKDFVWEK